MGLTASIFRDVTMGDTSNKGISRHVNRVTIVNVDGPFEPSDDAPAVELVRGNLPGTVKIVPVEHPIDDPDRDNYWNPSPMFGGCFVGTSDSRFGRAIAKLTGAENHVEGIVALHDRFETHEQTRALSR